MYTGRLTKKIARVRTTRVIQVPRASMSQRPGTRAELCRSWLSVISVGACRTLIRTLPACRPGPVVDGSIDSHETPGASLVSCSRKGVFILPSVPRGTHILPQTPSQNRYEKRYELLDLYDMGMISEGKMNLLFNKMLRQSLFQQAGWFLRKPIAMRMTLSRSCVKNSAKAISSAKR